MAHDTIPTRLVARALRRPTEPAYFVKRQGLWQATPWSDYAAEVRRAGAALVALGLRPGDGIALLARGGPEWTTLLLGAMSIGARPTGLYTSTPADEVVRLLAHSEARLVLLDDPARLDTVLRARAALPALMQVVSLTPTLGTQDTLVRGWDAFLRLGQPAHEEQADARREALRPDDVAALVYTAGVAEPPKGALLSHQNLTFTADAVRDVLRITSSDLSLSYLPLAHVAEQLASVHVQVSSGHTVYFPSGRGALADLREVQPTLVLGPPRLWEKLVAGTAAALTNLHEPRASMIAWARRLARNVVTAQSAGKSPPLEQGMQYEVARKLVLEPMRRALGLARARVCLSGVGPLDLATLDALATLGIQLFETYGMAETTGIATLNQPRRTRAGTAGPKLPSTQLVIASDGEVLVEGPHVFLGYHRDPEATARAKVEGRLRTGDLGQIDKEGFLRAYGPRRDLLTGPGGRTLAPALVEAALRGEPLVHDAVVLAERGRAPIALIVVDDVYANDLGLSGALHENEIVRERIDDQLRHVNQALHPSVRLSGFVVLPRRPEVAEGELTASMKPRRAALLARYASTVASSDASHAAAPVARPEPRAR
ncbi:MAG: AMP-binding protein [Polyangiales bacterium]